ncbi:hypothetical protein AQUCO_01500139v1 [Aquilegia coerulea]|uniref:Uncharacterized protein n=1 Tax=Aquilegia coerulea TaxID=218851 RepID=A0A2G5DT21_AQUCA|nr:hypothetical protein AQUCO_01500139v1 [Aquilegia coerulea]
MWVIFQKKMERRRICSQKTQVNKMILQAIQASKESLYSPLILNVIQHKALLKQFSYAKLYKICWEGNKVRIGSRIALILARNFLILFGLTSNITLRLFVLVMQFINLLLDILLRVL